MLRLFLSITALVHVGLVLGVQPAKADERIVFGHILSDTTAHHRNLLWAAERIEEVFEGEYHLEVYPKGLLGQTDLEVIEGFETGLTDMAYLSLGHIAHLYGPISIGAAPFVFRDFDHWVAFRRSDLFKELVARFEWQTGMRVLGLAYYGQRHVSSNRPVRSLEDLEGLVIRVPNIPTILSTFRWLGAKPVAIPFHEVYEALKSGLVEAQENPLPAIRAMRFHEVTRSITLTAHIADAQLLVFRRGRWLTLPPADRTRLARIFHEAADRVTADVREEELAELSAFRAQGMGIIDIDRAALAAAVRPHLESDASPWGADVYHRLQAIR